MLSAVFIDENVFLGSVRIKEIPSSGLSTVTVIPDCCTKTRAYVLYCTTVLHAYGLWELNLTPTPKMMYKIHRV